MLVVPDLSLSWPMSAFKLSHSTSLMLDGFWPNQCKQGESSPKSQVLLSKERQDPTHPYLGKISK